MKKFKVKDSILAKIATFFELPQDVALDLPRLVMTGNHSLLVENHRGLLAYSDQGVRIKTTKGEIQIFGHSLKLMEITKEEVQLMGWIERVQLEGWGD